MSNFIAPDGDAHLQTWEAEQHVSDADRSWYQFFADAEKLLGKSLDGDGATDGYSVDQAYDAWKQGSTAAQYVASIPS